MNDSDHIKKVNRRDFLRYVLLAAGVSVVGGGTYHYIKQVDLDDPLTIERIRNQFSDVEDSFRLIGEKYLELYPKELTTSSLLNELDKKLSSNQVTLGFFSDLKDLIEQQILLDYEHSEFVDIDGWMLTKTEARLCALIAQQDYSVS